MIIAVWIVVKGKLANKTVHYDAKIKTCQFDPEMWVIEKVNPGEKTGLTRVFEWGVRNLVQCDCKRYIAMLTEKIICCPENQHLSDKFTTVRLVF